MNKPPAHLKNKCSHLSINLNTEIDIFSLSKTISIIILQKDLQLLYIIRPTLLFY